jgi:hypothetical protein
VSVRELNGQPSMLPMFALAGAAMIPGASRLPFISGGGAEVPDLTLVLGDIEIDAERLAAYNRVCGFSVGDSVPATFPHVLAFPLHLALMTDGSFPFPAIGLVHIANRIVQHRPLRAAEHLSLKVWATPVQPHPRGSQFSIRSEARVGDELVWEDVSTNLRRGRDGGSGTSPEVPSASELPATATWTLAGDLGRQYGSVSGDINPIHVHSLSARLFGFPSAIAHGMWTKARCLAAMQPELPERFTVEVAFRKPILLPGSVQFAQAASDGGVQFGVRGAKGPHLDGIVEFG